MNYNEKTEIMDHNAAQRAISRISYQIIEQNDGAKDIVLIGIQTKGVALAKNAAKKIKEMEGVDVPLGSLDITFYRDDLTMLSQHPVIKQSDIPFSIDGKKIILVDDVLFTGRTIRAAIEELFDMGRPAKVELAVLIDRGHRELPIRADYIGKNVPASKKEYINAEVGENGDIMRVSLGVMQ